MLLLKKTSNQFYYSSLHIYISALKAVPYVCSDSLVRHYKVAVVGRCHHEKENHQSGLAFRCRHFFHGLPVECLEFDHSLSQLDEANSSSVILKGDSVQFGNGYLIEVVEILLTLQDKLLVDNRESLLIHPLVLTVNQEEEQASNEKEHRNNLRSSGSHKCSKKARNAQDSCNFQEVRTVDVGVQLIVREVRYALLDVMIRPCVDFISDFSSDTNIFHFDLFVAYAFDFGSPCSRQVISARHVISPPSNVEWT